MLDFREWAIRPGRWMGRIGKQGSSTQPAGHSLLLVIGILVYLAVIFAVMLWRGIDIEPQWVVLILLLIALLLGRGRQFITDWSPFLILFLAYEAMYGFAGKTGFVPHNIGFLEHKLFGFLPTVWLQQRLYDPARISLLDWITMGLYFMHFVIPLLVGFFLWVRSRRCYWRFVAALLLMCFIAFGTYLFFPSAPPWWQYHDEVHKIVDETIQKWGVHYFVSPVYTHFNPNQFAAFPSLHAAFPLLGAVFVWRESRIVGALLLLWAAGVWFAIVYLGEHYVVDALCGLVYVFFAVTVVTFVERRFWRHRPAVSGM
ncbi:MAG: phosphatase PAP2 family protein [Candidatus Dormibacteraceae bacterium]